MTSIEFLQSIGKEWAARPVLTVSERKIARKGFSARDFGGSLGFPDGSIVEYRRPPRMRLGTFPGPQFEKTVRDL